MFVFQKNVFALAIQYLTFEMTHGKMTNIG